MSQVVETDLMWQTRIVEEPLEIPYQIARPHSCTDVGGEHELQFLPLISALGLLCRLAPPMRLEQVCKVLGQWKRAPAVFAFRGTFADHAAELLRLLGN